MELLRGLVIHNDNMEKNLNMLSDIYRSHITLLALVSLGLTRDDGYKIVQRNSMNIWSKKFDSLVSSLENVNVNDVEEVTVTQSQNTVSADDAGADNQDNLGRAGDGSESGGGDKGM